MQDLVVDLCGRFPPWRQFSASRRAPPRFRVGDVIQARFGPDAHFERPADAGAEGTTRAHRLASGYNPDQALQQAGQMVQQMQMQIQQRPEALKGVTAGAGHPRRAIQGDSAKAPDRRIRRATN